MRLASFRIERYRSIIRARKIGTKQVTVLLGPNNEGKSNILRALATALQVLMSHAHPVSGTVAYRRLYDWRTDYPVKLQITRPDLPSVIQLEFELSPAEVDDFRREIGSKLNGTLPLEVSLHKANSKITVAKQGKGHLSLSKKSKEISAFVARRLHFQYIPPIRTAESAQRVITTLIATEFEGLEESPEYIEAIERIVSLQKPLIDSLAAKLKQTLVAFLPRIRDVDLSISRDQRFRALRTSDIYIDDGARTLLQSKGDGVQSLATLGIMRHASEQSVGQKHFIIAIEEPESHLHPKAIHAFREVLLDLSESHQLVIASHCPLFVNRTDITSNIIVQSERAKPAESICEIREVLGVRASDNLRSAHLVLVVEGHDDKIALEALLTFYNKRLRDALHNGSLAIETLHGGSNLNYVLGLLQNALCLTHSLMDDDDTGRLALKKATDQGLLKPGEYHVTSRLGHHESELEDLYNPDLYQDLFKNMYSVNIDPKKYKKYKWSTRIGNTFKESGVQWNDNTKAEVKLAIAKLVIEYPGKALSSSHSNIIESLSQALETRLGATKRTAKSRLKKAP